MKKYALLIVFILGMTTLLLGCQQNRFEEGFVPATYGKSDVYYKIYTTDEIRYMIAVTDIIKEKDKEAIYKIRLSNDLGHRRFDLEWSETKYNSLVGEDANAISLSYSTLSLLVESENKEEFNCDSYEYRYNRYSFEDGYSPFTEENMQSEVEDFLIRIHNTIKEQFKEYKELRISNYEVSVYDYGREMSDGSNKVVTGYTTSNLEEVIIDYQKLNQKRN